MGHIILKQVKNAIQLKNLLSFKQLFLRRLQASYLVVSYNKKERSEEYSTLSMLCTILKVWIVTPLVLRSLREFILHFVSFSSYDHVLDRIFCVFALRCTFSRI